jgi:hypothetical protein
LFLIFISCRKTRNYENSPTKIQSINYQQIKYRISSFQDYLFWTFEANYENEIHVKIMLITSNEIHVNFTWKFSCEFTFDALFTWNSREFFHVNFTWNSREFHVRHIWLCIYAHANYYFFLWSQPLRNHGFNNFILH